MPILPIDTGRYGTPEMLSVFQEETRIQKLLDVEAALALAHGEVGNIPKKDAEKIFSMASTRYVKLERIKAIEKEIKHDLASLVRALSEQCGPSSAYVHLGATSYDIVDTANALQLKEAFDVLEKKTENILPHQLSPGIYLVVFKTGSSPLAMKFLVAGSGSGIR